MKRLLLILGILVIMLLAAAGGLSWWVLRGLGAEMWVRQIEQAAPCRAEIASASLGLLSSPARLVLKGVKLAPRDAECARPPAERAPLADGVAPVHIPEVVLELRLEDLLNRRLRVEKLRLVSPVVREAIDSSGRSTLEALFRPAEEGRTAAGEVPRAIPVNAAGAPAAGGGKEGAFAFSIQSASIEKGSLSIQNAGGNVAVTDLDFELTGIDIDARDLAAHNKMTARLAAAAVVTGQARIAGARQQATLADVRLSGISQIRPLDPATGRWQPASVLKLTLEPGSVIAGHMTMGDAAGKEMRKLQEYGIDLSPVRVGGPLKEPAVVEGSFQANRFSLLADARFVFPDYEVALQRKSYVNAAADRHEIELRLSCGPELQGRLQQGLSQARLGDSITRGIMKALADERGRMTFDIESEGSLSDPQIKPKVDRILKNLVRGEGLGDLLQGLLKKL